MFNMNNDNIIGDIDNNPHELENIESIPHTRSANPYERDVHGGSWEDTFGDMQQIDNISSTAFLDNQTLKFPVSGSLFTITKTSDFDDGSKFNVSTNTDDSSVAVDEIQLSPIVLMKESFDGPDETRLVDYSTDWLASEANGEIKIDQDEKQDGIASLRVKTDTADSAPRYCSAVNYINHSGVEFYMKFTTNTGNAHYSYFQSFHENEPVYKLISFFGGSGLKVRYYDAKNIYETGSLSKNTWYKLTLKYDMNAERYSGWIDGGIYTNWNVANNKRLYEDLLEPWAGVLAFSSGSAWNGINVTSWFDNLTVSGFPNNGTWESGLIQKPADKDLEYVNLNHYGLSSVSMIDNIQFLVNGGVVAEYDTAITSGLTTVLTETGLTWGSFGNIDNNFTMKINMSSNGARTPVLTEITGKFSKPIPVVLSKPITIDTDSRWDSMVIDKFEHGNDSLRISILDINKHGISGFENITYGGELDISAMDPSLIPTILLKAEFTSTEANAAPAELYYWAVSWNRTDCWRDTFYEELKVGAINSATAIDGLVKTDTAGSVASNSIPIPDKYYFKVLKINKSEPAGCFINVSIQNGQTGKPLTGYENLTGTDIDITGIDTPSLNAIKLKAYFAPSGGKTAELYSWSVSWIPNSAPKITSINSAGTVNRTKSATIRIDCEDNENTEAELSVIVLYKAPSASVWSVITPAPVFVLDHWDCTFTPDKSAELGDYLFSFTCRDAFLDEDIFAGAYSIKVLNNDPVIVDITLTATEVYRTETVTLGIDTTDVETAENVMQISCRYKAPGDIVWKTNYISAINFLGGKWDVDFSPNKNAVLGNYFFELVCNDTVSEVYGNANILVLNNIPLINSVNIPKTHVYRTEKIDFVIDASDVEKSESELNLNIFYKTPADVNWKSNFLSPVQYHTDNWFVSFTPGKSAECGFYTFNISCNDSDTTVYSEFILEILNNIPTKVDVFLKPTNPKTTDDIEVRVSNADDVETPDANLEYWYRWFKNGVHVPELDDFTLVMYERTTKGEVWRCEVVVFDGIDTSPTNDDSVTIQNSPPVVAAPIDRVNILEDGVDSGSVDLSSVFHDADSDTLSYSYDGADKLKVMLNQETGRVTLTPPPDWFGNEQITFSASDGEAEIYDTALVVVEPQNDPPYLVTAGKTQIYSKEKVIKFSVLQNKWFNITLKGNDIDGDSVVFSTNRSDNIGKDDIDRFELKNDEISFLAKNEDVGTIFINISVSDMNGSIVYYLMELLVINVNDPPTVSIEFPSDGSSFEEGQEVAFQCSYTDLDLDIPDSRESLHFTWRTNLSTNELASGNYKTNFSSSELVPGIHGITVTVEDSDGRKSSETITVHITEKPEVEKKPSETSTSSSYLWVVLVIILIIIIAVILVFVLRKRKREKVEVEYLPPTPAVTTGHLPGTTTVSREAITAPVHPSVSIPQTQYTAQLPGTVGTQVSQESLLHQRPQPQPQPYPEPFQAPQPRLPPFPEQRISPQSRIEAVPIVHEGDKSVWLPDTRNNAVASKEILEQIEKLAEMKERGILTEEEFQRKKQELLK